MPKSPYLADAVINHVLRGERYVPPEKVYVGLHTLTPMGLDSGTEVSSPDYDRQVVSLQKALNRETTNSNRVVFPRAQLPWGQITAFGIFDAHVGGNLLYFGPFSTAKIVEADDEVVFEIGQLVLVEN